MGLDRLFGCRVQGLGAVASRSLLSLSPSLSFPPLSLPTSLTHPLPLSLSSSLQIFKEPPKRLAWSSFLKIQHQLCPTLNPPES